MQKVNSNGLRELTCDQQYGEAQTGMYAGFRGRLVYRRGRNGEFCIMMSYILNPFADYITSYRELAPTAYNFVNGCNHDYKFCLTFCSRMRPNLQGCYQQHKEFALLGTIKFHTRSKMSFSKKELN